MMKERRRNNKQTNKKFIVISDLRFLHIYSTNIQYYLIKKKIIFPLKYIIKFMVGNFFFSFFFSHLFSLRFYPMELGII